LEHRPVMLAEALEQLELKQEGLYIDCTFGRGGHSSAILNFLDNTGKLIAFDQDITAHNSDAAIALAQDNRFTLLHKPFSNLQLACQQLGIEGKVNGILLDLGVSSPQLDNAERGFSFLRDGPLDMRMNTTHGLTAEAWLKSTSESAIVKVLFDYGEERFARKIANAIITTREHTPLVSTKQLADIVANAVPFHDRHKHPATRTFQAIRIAVNAELDELKAVLDQAIPVLTPGGRLVVMSFHSLEDRLVKRFFRAESGAKYNPGRLPILERDICKGALKTCGKAIKASAEELRHNPRARSAIMRVTEKR
jgi:16S rRNA (cytosine1402-N4)-methyltransferase